MPELTRVLGLTVIFVCALGCGASEEPAPSEPTPAPQALASGSETAPPTATTEPPPTATTEQPPADPPPVAEPPADAECTSAAQCVGCTFETEITRASECECGTCSSGAMTPARCEAIMASYRRVCAGFLRRRDCPPVTCAPATSRVACTDWRCTSVPIPGADPLGLDSR